MENTNNSAVNLASGNIFPPNVLVYEQVIENIKNLLAGQGSRHIALCGIDAGADAHKVGQELAQTLALSNHAVLLIRISNSTNGPSDGIEAITQLLRSKKNIEGGLTALNLNLSDLPRPASAQEKDFGKLLKDMETIFGAILWDIPPVDQSVQSRMIAHHTQGVVLVAEAGKTRWPSALYAIEHFRFSECAILGIILNKKKNYIPNWLYRLLFKDI